MDMNQKMVADTLIIIGVILVILGWSGRSIGGLTSVLAYILIGIGIVVGGLGLARYGQKK